MHWREALLPVLHLSQLSRLSLPNKSTNLPVQTMTKFTPYPFSFLFFVGQGVGGGEVVVGPPNNLQVKGGSCNQIRVIVV